MNDCLFCNMVKGEIPAKTIYEDEKIKVFLDINPTTDGHMLMIPKKHYQDIKDIEIETLEHMMIKLKEEVIPLLEEKLGCLGFTLSQNNGIVEEVKHFHIHITPRYDDDDLKIIPNKEKQIGIEKIYERLTK